jgi:hypothetical protein
VCFRSAEDAYSSMDLILSSLLSGVHVVLYSTLCIVFVMITFDTLFNSPFDIPITTCSHLYSSFALPQIRNACHHLSSGFPFLSISIMLAMVVLREPDYVSKSIDLNCVKTIFQEERMWSTDPLPPHRVRGVSSTLTHLYRCGGVNKVS